MLGKALAAACADRAVLARIGGRIGEAARAALTELEADPDRRASRIRWTARLRAPVPAGFRGVDASWIEAALVELPFAARDALASTELDPTRVWLARWATATIPPLPAIDHALTRPRSIAEAVALAPLALRAWLDDIALDQLAFALGAQLTELAPSLLLALRVGSLQDARDRIAVVQARIAQSPRAGELGGRRAAISRVRDLFDDLVLVRIAGRTLASYLDPLTRRQLAHRLLRPVGSALATAADSADGGDPPTWIALGA